MDFGIYKDRFKNLSLTTFENELLISSLQNLLDQNNKLRLNNFSYSIREFTRHVLKRLAPDEKVLNCIWFIPDNKKEPQKITRKQRIKYAIQGGLIDDYIENDLGIDVKYVSSVITNSIDILSKFTHIEPSSYNSEPKEIENISEEIMRSLLLFFKTIADCRNKIISSLEVNIDREIVNNLFYESIDQLDKLSTHHFIQYFFTNEITVDELTETHLHIIAEGNVSVKLQFGSNSDLRDDIGYETEESFPFKCELLGKINQSKDFEIEERSFEVNTDDYYE